MDLFETDKGSNAPEYSVSELSTALKKTVEESYAHVRVRGELGRVTRAASGHMYLDLKDEKAVINCNIWRPIAERLDFRPEEGMEVIATGKLSTYAPRSGYNLIIERLEIAGEGALMALLEKRKKAFAAEGLFDASRKQKLPYLPQKIGVITSPTGAVIRDILHRLNDRFPREVLLWPVAVQGKSSAEEVANAIRGFNALTPSDPLRPDLLIVARGGGSLEDLWGFNEEIVIRAVAESKIPVISAVGHETDTTLIDYVSDRRAPTPTAAAEIAVPVRADLMAFINDLDTRRMRALQKLREVYARRLQDLSLSLPKPNDLLGTPSQRLDLASAKLNSALQKRVAIAKESFNAYAHKLSPRALLAPAKERYSQIAPRLSAQKSLSQARDIFYATSPRLTPKTVTNMLQSKSQNLQLIGAQLLPSLRKKTERATAELHAQTRILNALSYTKVLERGFAVIRDIDGRVLKSAEETRKSNRIIIEQQGGQNTADIKE